MRKITIVIMGIFMIISFSTMASAETQTSASSGAAITFASATDAGPGITFTPSPSTIVSGSTAETTFTITSGSSKAGENGIEYGIVSTDAGIYQRSITTTTYIPQPTASATALPGTGWLDKAGNAPGS